MAPMDSRFRPTFLLIPVSMMLLSILRCWQFITDHGNPREWLRFKAMTPMIFDPALYSCDHSYTIELLSIDPLVLYINDFVKDKEIDHLLALGETRFAPSQVTYGTDQWVNTTVRQSQTAYLPTDDVVCSCLTQRMKSLLGNVQHTEVEGLQIVKYQQGSDRFKVHTDWFREHKNDTYHPDGSARQSNRLGSIFVYLDANCTRGETYFPELPSISESADGDKFAIPEGGSGLLVRPRRGSAVFWNNLHPNGSGDDRVAHAGLQIESGTKVGLNMWSSYFFDLPMVGDK